ncbi:hypothetical protein QFC24_006656 [Naganishia onofrii]|uniref:Uncharacterized protein n=1 Tax=Naganishia onofrii TaxID=1851511 RepID=A0ACC2WZL6_9TREE|nr:hypothetical protein QFC24_006656 [Naganishia onofrii]
MTQFIYTPAPTKVIFGSGALSQIREVVLELHCERALVIVTNGQIEQGRHVMNLLGNLGVSLCHKAVMHTPEDVTESVVYDCKDIGVDCLVAIGGGSTIGLSKALALRTNLPQVFIPTTYAGSEATPIVGQSKGGVKTTQVSPTVLPKVIIYDVHLTDTLPLKLTLLSGFNAMAHAIEALYAQQQNPITEVLAKRGIASFVKSLPALLEDPHDESARTEALIGAWMCGTCLASAGMALHHKLCHTLGGSFGLPHAEIHTVVLPHAIAYNTEAARASLDKVARILGTDNAAQGIYDLQKRLGVVQSLKELGLKEEDLPKAAEIAMSRVYHNPAKLSYEGILALLTDAYYGRRPS